MSETEGVFLHERPEFRAVCGEALRPGGLELTAEALALAAWPPGSRLLDLGCGAGATLGFLRSRGFEAQGLELSPALAAEARTRGPVLEGDFHDPPLAGESFDGLWAECVLSLARDPREVLSQAFRLLKPGGALVVSDLVRRGGGPAEPARAGGVVAAAELAGWLAEAGFQIVHQLDRSRALAELAAKLVWHLGAERARAALGCGIGGRDYGYALLIARK